MKLIYRLLLLLCLLLPGRGMIGISHAAHHNQAATASRLHTERLAQPTPDQQSRIRQLLVKVCNPDKCTQAGEPRAAIAEDEDSDDDDDDRDERTATSDAVPVHLFAFSLTGRSAIYSPASVACAPANSRPFVCPTTGHRLALLSTFRI